MRKVREGGVYIGTSDAKGTLQLKDKLLEKLGPHFETKKPKEIGPKILISGISKQYESDILIDELVATNSRICDQDKEGMKVLSSFKIKTSKSKTKWSYIMEVTGNIYSKVINNYILLDYNYHLVKEYVHTLRCYWCQGYNHSSKNCTADLPVCCYCGEFHDSRDCNSQETQKCFNCNEAISKGAFYEIHHKCGSQSCSVQLSMVKKQQSKLNYNIKSLSL